MRAIIASLLAVAGCGSDGPRSPGQPVPSGKDQMIAQHRQAVRLEDRDIALYIERHGLVTVKSGTGVHVQLLRDSPGDPVRREQAAMVNYRLELLNGDTAYATDPGMPETFRVEHDDVESGLHEAIQLLSAGDSAVIIIPSYRAHGLVGDLDRVPPRSSVVYRLGFVRVMQ
ncbi:MAG: FKBP-type peptidyl-prolyl cis-trans isomerase [Flavobacteriales bacterium]|nr:FKBP-type peptidyl-prolyl cis-trans isomerase [Flavobacteriales bacterium]